MRRHLTPRIAGGIALLGIGFALGYYGDSGDPRGTEGDHQPQQVGHEMSAPSDSPHGEESSLARRVRGMLEAIIIPQVYFENTTVEEAVDFLRLRVRELDPEPDPHMRGISIHLRRTADSTSAGYDLQADNISAWALLNRIARDNRLVIQVTDRGIELTPSMDFHAELLEAR
ncbi:hypothetical protein OKA04_20730 [Luteolibacter flavescens]|uniref:GerMN domain-containing protein n=1 Tax=Luteolibacter flavescens TaxID=1859460 RepID=A0ABT3FUF0_9BACT|nr:hypothetical protein [Luteolibacter flavescens]MCW1887177.1 hypothetical protein [Luteolibacter flavescens]